MKNIIFLLTIYLVIFLVLTQQGSSQKQNGNGKVTKLIFNIQQSVQQEKDFVQLNLVVRDQQTSLTKAMADVKLMIEQIRKISTQYCEKEGGSQCQDNIEVDNYDVEFKYQIVKRQPSFVGFIVSHQVKITVLQTQNIGVLVDSIKAMGIYRIKSLQWLPFEQIDAQQQAIEAGKQQGNELCGHLNKKMGDVLLIQQVLDQSQDNQQQDGNGQLQQQQEEKPSTLVFEVECVQKKEQDKKKKEKKKKR